MSPALAIILTLLLLAAFVFGLVKDYKPVVWLCLLSLVGCIIFTLITGKPVATTTTKDGEVVSATGNLIIDCFELFNTTLKSQMGGALLTILCVLGFVGYMNHLQASNKFALFCVKPFTKLKNPAILCAGVIILVFFLKLAIPSAVSLAALMLATMYPVLRAAGCTPMTSASCIMCSTGFIWGPADTMSAQVFSVSGIQAATVPEFFAAFHIPVWAIMVPLVAICFPIYSTIMDKRDAKKAAKKAGTDEIVETNEKPVIKADCPGYYAILPILPLVIVLIFSKINPMWGAMGIKPIVLSVVGAVFMSIIITMLVDLIHEKNVTKIIDDANEFFVAMAMFLKNGGWLIIPAAMFATTLDKIGGLQAIANLLANAGGNGFIITLVGVIIVLPIVICTGSVTATIAIGAPLMVAIAGATGMNVYLCFMALLVGLGIASCMCPVHPQTIMVSANCGVDLFKLIGRNAGFAIPEILIGIIICLIVCPMVSGDFMATFSNAAVGIGA